MSFATAVFPFKDHFRYAVYEKDRAGLRMVGDGCVGFEDLDALKKFRKLACRGELCCGVGAEKTFSSFLDVPFNESGVLDRVVKFEAEPFIPLEPEDVFTGYTADVAQSSGADTKRVLALCVDKKGVQGVQERLRTVGLWPSFEPEVLAVANGFMSRHAQGSADFALLCVRPSYSFWCLVRGGLVCDLGFYNCGFDRMGQEGFDFALESNVCALFADRLKQVFSEWDSPVVVVGEQAGRFVEGALPQLSGTALKELDGGDDYYSLLFEGLARKGFGLSPVKFDFVEKTADFIFVALRKFIITACLMCVVLGVFAAGQYRAYNAVKQQTLQAKRRIETLFYDTFGPDARLVDPVSQLQVYLENRGTGTRGMLDGAVLPDVFRVIDEAAAKTGGIKVDRLSLLEDGLHVEGTCTQLLIPERFAVALKDSGRFADVRVESVDSGTECVFKVFAQL